MNLLYPLRQVFSIASRSHKRETNLLDSIAAILVAFAFVTLSLG